MEDPIEQALQALAEGKFIVVTDDSSRENEADLILAAEAMNVAKMRFLLQHSSGVVCVPMKEERLNELDLPLMVNINTEVHRTAFTVSVDLKDKTSTGISVEDRAATVKALADPCLRSDQLRRPGHIFPLRAVSAGVLQRPGHTEAAVDLLQLAGCEPVGVICELVNSDYSMMRGEDVETFAKQYQLPLISIADLITYRKKKEKLIEAVCHAPLPTAYGLFRAHVYKSLLDGVEHIALVHGQVRGEEDVLVRVHSECLTGDVFGSKRCDCGAQMQRALERIVEQQKGVLIYLRGHEGRGIGLGNKLKAYLLQDEGLDTVEANVKLGFPIDARDYTICSQILSDLGLTSIHLLTNNPEKCTGLNGMHGITVTKRISLLTDITPENVEYLRTKKQKLGHQFEVEVKDGCC